MTSQLDFQKIWISTSEERGACPGGGSTNHTGVRRTAMAHYDRIVITHVHSDHVGGLITAGQYARQKDSMLSADMLVSNHGEHDLDVVIRESKLKSLLAVLRSRPIVGMNDRALTKLAFDAESIAIEGFMLNRSSRSRNENTSSLVLKVTEIRDGQRRATLFLGDIERSQQAELLSHSDAGEIFRNVRAVTLPHHGRPATLHRLFFDRLKKLAGSGVIVLHSDRAPLDRRIAAKAAKAGITVKSTGGSATSDVFVNLFGNEKTFHVVEDGATTLPEIVMKEKRKLIAEGNFSAKECVDAVSRYCNRPVANHLPTGTFISWPSDAWLRKDIEARRKEFNREVERLIAQFQSLNTSESTEAEQALAARRAELNQEQIDRIDIIAQEVAVRRHEEFNRETEHFIAQLQSPNASERKEAEQVLAARYAELTREQVGRIELISFENSRNSETAKLIARIRNCNDDLNCQLAVLMLSRMRNEISRAKVRDLIDAMRNGKYASTRYYAASALINMRSRHISDTIAAEAKRVKADNAGKWRITTPRVERRSNRSCRVCSPY